MPKESLVVFDPACGSGEFLRETLRQLLLNGYKGKISLIGWDISSAACDMAKFTLAWEMRGYQKLVAVSIECTDSLIKENWPREVDLVLMNPPFVSWGGMDAEQRRSVKDTLGQLFAEQPDMSSAFLVKAALCLRVGGVIGSILPASFLNGTATRKIRGELSQLVSTKLVARLGSHLLFPNAMIDAALYVGRTGNDERTPTIAFWADYRSASNAGGLRALRKIRHSSGQTVYPVVDEGYSIYPAPELGTDSGSWAPRPYISRERLRSLEHLPRVNDVFEVRKGAQTGHNESFIIRKEDWQGLPKSERRFFRPAVMNESIKYGFLMDSAYVFYPYGKNAIETEQQLRDSVRTYYKSVLKDKKDQLATRTGIAPQKWWKLRRHLPWQVNRISKIVSTFFGDAGSVALDHAGEYVVVQGNAWLFKRTDNFTEMPKKVWLAYLAILNSSLFSELLSAACNHVGGGQWDLSKRFVDRIPLPNLLSDQLDPTMLTKLSSMGDAIQKGLPINDEELGKMAVFVYQ